jgi:salicylate hydroxylase
MPPQGQSIGLAFEDAVILAKVLGEMKDEATVEERLRRYDELRRPRVAAARKEAAKSRESLKEVHWFVQWCREWLYWFFLAVFAKHSEEAFLYDVEKETI